MNHTTELIDELAQTLASRLPDNATMTDIEKQTKQLMHEVGQQVLRQHLDQTIPTYPEPSVECHCGHRAEYKWRRSGHFYTIYGKIMLKRPYYLCPNCRHGCYPLDQQLGLKPNQFTPELSRLVAMTGVGMPFMAGRDLFEELTQVSVSDQAMGKATQQVGETVAKEEQIWQEKAEDEAFLLQQKREARRPRRLYGSMDAVKVHIRGDEEHGWRDLKIGAFYEARGCPPSKPDGKWGIRAENMHYFADICQAKEFAPLVWGHGVKQSAQLADELIFVGDGAEWIWNIVEEKFPKAIQILDWFHAVEYLRPAAQAIFVNLEEQEKWVSKAKTLLWEGKVEEVIVELDDYLETNGAEAIRITANYYENNKERMKYKRFRNNGYQIGSGTIESAAKQVGLMRLKVPGAIWNESSARLVAKARAAFLSDRWESLPLAA